VIQSFSPLRGDSFGAAASNLIPQGIKQGLELSGNRDFFRGNPIASDNADERASAFSRGVAGAANAAGRAVGSDFLQNVRPSQAEHLVNALPAYGDIVKGASDMLAPSGFKQAEDRPIQNEPFVGGIAQRFIRDTGGANLTRAQDAALSDSVRSLLQDAGMRPGAVDLSLPSEYKNAPLTREEQLRWQSVFNSELNRSVGMARRSDEWRNPATREKAVREAIAAARQQAAERARLPNEQQLENRIRRQQSMKAS
jgi:cyclophilin family peptidyl-prolyl cis-trans isomerase